MASETHAKGPASYFPSIAHWFQVLDSVRDRKHRSRSPS